MQDLFHIIRVEMRGAWRYRWWAVIIAWAICMAGWSLVFSLPDIYEARARVYVDADSRLADVMGQVGVNPGVGSRVYIVRQAMLGRPQLERVARETGLDLRATNEEEMGRMLQGLRDRVGIVSGQRSQARNLYVIRYTDSDREMAIAVVQELLDTFVEDVLELKEQGSEDVSGYLEDQLNHYLGLLTEADLALANFRKEYVGLLPGDRGGIFDRLQAELDRLEDLRSDLQTEIDRRNELRRQLTAERPYLPDDNGSGTGAPVPGSSAESTINELEGRRAELLLTYTDRHPDIVAINEQLEQLYQQREDDRLALAGSETGMEGIANATNPVYQSVQISLNESGVRIAALRSQIAQREATARELNNQIDTIPEVEARYAELNRNYEQYSTLYNQLLVRKERERMGTTVGEDREVVSFNVIDPPSASFDPVAPRRALFLIAVFIIGLGAGGVTAFAIHKLNPVFHDARTLRTVTERPVLGVVSMTWLERHQAGRTLDYTTFLLAGGSLFLIFVAAVLLQEQFISLMQIILGDG